MDGKIERSGFLKNRLVIKAANTLFWGLRSTFGYSTHFVRSILNSGSKNQVNRPENELLYLSAGVLAEKIRRAELSSEEVVKAYIDRITEVNGLLNAVVAERFAEATQEAKRADQLVRSGTMSEAQIAERLPLLGVPFTAKEQVLIKGLPCTCGLLSRKGMVSGEDSEAVRRMRGVGAIPLASTNTSELCLWVESYNNLHGTTNNPYNTTRTAGGSSGGEAALIAAAGSVIGIGSDLGGSIRIPAFFNGIFGHFPTVYTVPSDGLYPAIGNDVSVYACVGPMTRYATDMKLVLSAVLGREMTAQLQLFQPVDLRSVKVYYMLDDRGTGATSPVTIEIKEAIRKVVNVLSVEGLSVQEICLKELEFAFFIWCAFLGQVKDQRPSRLLLGDLPIKECEEAYGPWLLLQWFLGKSDHVLPVLVLASAVDLVPFLQKELRFLRDLGDKLKADLLSFLGPEPAVFLYPTWPHPATYHGQTLSNMCNIGYSVIFNALGLPCTQCPLGMSAGGLPIGMQIVTAPHNDRLSLRLAEHLEEKLGGWTPPSSVERKR